MEKYPAGRFILSYGVAMCFITALLEFTGTFEKLFGEKVLPYLVFIVIAILVFSTLWFYRTCKSKTTVIIGTIGWITTFILLYIHYSNQTFK